MPHEVLAFLAAATEFASDTDTGLFGRERLDHSHRNASRDELPWITPRVGSLLVAGDACNRNISVERKIAWPGPADIRPWKVFRRSVQDECRDFALRPRDRRRFR